MNGKRTATGLIMQMILERDVRENWVANEVGITPKTFYGKIANDTFKARELMEIADLLDYEVFVKPKRQIQLDFEEFIG